jgi:hypothetical protein
VKIPMPLCFSVLLFAQFLVKYEFIILNSTMFFSQSDEEAQGKTYFSDFVLQANP